MDSRALEAQLERARRIKVLDELQTRAWLRGCRAGLIAGGTFGVSVALAFVLSGWPRSGAIVVALVALVALAIVVENQPS